jgi:hypothetical protein
MNVNVGIMDRTARAIIGLLLIAYAIPFGFPSTGWNWVGWIGIVPIVTAAGLQPVRLLLLLCRHPPALSAGCPTITGDPNEELA